MPVEIVPYASTHVRAVQAFNERLRTAGVTETFGIRSLLRETYSGPPIANGSGLYEELFLAVDGEAVRGGYTLKHQDFVINGAVTSVGFFQQAVSEGTIDKRHALIAPRMLRHALGSQPLIYGLGIGGYDQAVARLLKGARFEMVTVPFYFRVEHAARFLRQVGALRTSTSRRVASDVAARSGLGALGIGLIQRFRAGLPRDTSVKASDVGSFEAWAEPVWKSGFGRVEFGAVRNLAVLSQLYDSPGNAFIKIFVENAGLPCGWAVCLATQRRGDKYFGDLKLGSIVDLLAVPGHEVGLIGAAVDRLRREGVDLIVTNQSFGPLGQALRSSGFLSGPSNFLFAASPKLAESLTPLETGLSRYYLNRGDGDGPGNL
jgi:hypothetical protein